MDHDLGSRDAAMIVRCSGFRCWSLSRLAFWHFRSLVPKPVHPSPNFPHHMVLGISCVICGKSHPAKRFPNAFRSPHTCLQIPQISVIRFLCLRFICSILWRVISMCKSSKFKNKIQRKNHETSPPQLSIRKLCSMRCFDHISTQFVRYIHKLPPHKCALYLFPGEKKGCDSL